jgi:hypothetical protein
MNKAVVVAHDGTWFTVMWGGVPFFESRDMATAIDAAIYIREQYGHLTGGRVARDTGDKT